jgi:Flp pilus assembly protein protease CpaA
MDHVNPSLWPLIGACALLVIAAVINLRSLTVPNRLTLSAILVGWLMSYAITAATEVQSRGGAVLPSLSATAVGLLLLLPFYNYGSLGAGCVKMQMAFGAWVGCAADLRTAVFVTAFATIVGMLFTAIGVLYAALQLRSRRVRVIGGASIMEALFPAQVTLSCGSVCGVIIAVLIGWI